VNPENTIVLIALKRPYTFVVLAILILIFGGRAAMRTPTDIFPNIAIPIVAASEWERSSLNGQHENKAAIFIRIESPFTNRLRRSQYDELLTQRGDVVEHVRAPYDTLVLAQQARSGIV